MIIEKTIRLGELLDEHYHRLTKLRDLIDKKSQKNYLLSDNWKIFVYIKSIFGLF